MDAVNWGGKKGTALNHLQVTKAVQEKSWGEPGSRRKTKKLGATMGERRGNRGSFPKISPIVKKRVRHLLGGEL